ncbi:MAG TPA: hypothetical protein VN783_09790 [Thermoanaerobaculia bacterium]|nr:hypothetical protein [Thermoanaerobaculia bacterium]
MRKKTKKLALSKETLGALADGLPEAVGVGPNTAPSYCGTCGSRVVCCACTSANSCTV